MHSITSKLILITFTALLLSYCTANDEKTIKAVSMQETDGNLSIRSKRPLDPASWECYDIQYDRICCPNQWQPFRQSKHIFYTPLDDSSENTFFVVLRQDTFVSRLDLDKYLAAGYQQLKADTSELLSAYTLNELVFDDKKAYYGEFTTNINDTMFISFTMYTEVAGLVYDLTLKVLLQTKEVNRELFQDLLYNYLANGKNLFNEKDELVSIQKIDLETY